MAEAEEGTETLRRRWAQTLGGDPNSTAWAADCTYKPAAGKQAAGVPNIRLPDGVPEFQPIDELGRGGMGVVFRALQTSLQREVALKSLRVDLAPDELRREQFLSEARLTGRLEHPNIVPVHALSSGAQGEPTLAMKLVGGRPWSELLRAGEVDAREQLEVLIQVCQAVAYAHDQGILHCDLKPGNVMLGQFGEVLVMDWGLAVGFREKIPGLRHRSDLEGPCGTPAYMPPELAQGEGSRLGPWTDVFMLGGILYRILTGQPPFGGKSLFQVVIAAARGVIEPLAEHHPEGLRRLCQHALEPDPQKRCASVAEFLQGLRAHRVHSQSETIRKAAEERLRTCKLRASSGALLDEESRDLLYEEFAEAVAGFGNALQLWEHPEARDGAARARLAFARAALLQGDLGLARAQLARVEACDGLAVDVAEVRGFLERSHAQKHAEQRGKRRQKWLLLAAGLLIFGLVVAGWLSSSLRQQRLVDARQHALDTLGFAKAGYTDALAFVKVRLKMLADAPQQGREEGGVLAPLAPLSAEDRRKNREAVLGLLAGVRREQQLLELATAPVDDRPHEFLSPGMLQIRSARMREAQEQAFELAFRCEAWDLSEMAALSMDAPLRDEFVGRVREGREQQLQVQLRRTREALEDLRRGRQRDDRPSWGPTPQESIVELSAYRRPEVVEVLHGALRPYLARMRSGEATVWSQPEREELEVILRVLGHLDLAPYTIPVLGSFLEVVRDPELTVIAGEALCATRDPAANEILVSQVLARLGPESQIWQQIRRVFGRVPLSDPDAVLDKPGDYVDRGLIREYKGDRLGALADYERALALDPDYVGALGNRATLLCQLDRHDEAIIGLSRAIELRPANVAGYVNRGCVYLKLGSWQAALADFDAALALEPGSAWAYNNRGLVWFELGELDRAIEDFSAALREEPTLLEALLNRGDAQQNAGRLQEAADDWYRLIDLDPGNVSARSRLGQLLQRVGSPDRALSVLTEAIILKPDYPPSYYERGLAYFKLGRFGEAIQDLSVYLKYCPEEAMAWKNRGNAWARLGEQEAALEDYGRAIELREDFLALYRRAFVWLELDRPTLAIDDMGRVLHAPCHYEISEAQTTQILKSAAELAATLSGRMAQEAGEENVRRDWTERAFAFLRRRAELGPIDLERLRGQPELQELIDDPRWEALFGGPGNQEGPEGP